MTGEEWKRDFIDYVNDLRISEGEYNEILRYIHDGCAIMESRKASAGEVVYAADEVVYDGTAERLRTNAWRR